MPNFPAHKQLAQAQIAQANYCFADPQDSVTASFLAQPTARPVVSLAGTYFDTWLGGQQLRQAGYRPLYAPLSATPDAQNASQYHASTSLLEQTCQHIAAAIAQGAQAAFLYCNSLTSSIDLEQVRRRFENFPIITPWQAYQQLTLATLRGGSCTNASTDLNNADSLASADTRADTTADSATTKPNNLLTSYHPFPALQQLVPQVSLEAAPLVFLLGANANAVNGVEKLLSAMHPSLEFIGVGCLPLVEYVEFYGQEHTDVVSEINDCLPSSRKHAPNQNHQATNFSKLKDALGLDAVAAWVKTLARQRKVALVLCCTHFPYYKAELAQLFAHEHVSLIDPAELMLEQLKKSLG